MGWIVAKNDKAFGQVLTSILVEKYLDLVMLSLALLGVTVFSSISFFNQYSAWIVLITAGVSVFLFLAVILFPVLWSRIKNKFPAAWAWPAKLDALIQQMACLFTFKRLFPLILVSVVIWFFAWLTNLLLFKVFSMPVNALAACLVLVSIYIGLLPALMPGNIGPFYFFGRIALLPFGILDGVALSYAIVLHAVVTLPPLLMGGIFLLSGVMNKSWKRRNE